MMVAVYPDTNLTGSSPRGEDGLYTGGQPGITPTRG